MLCVLMVRKLPRVQLRQYATSLKEYESLYDILETDPTATKTEIRESWLRLSMLHHPDLNPDSEEARDTFVKIKDAYKTLIDEKSRMKYNDSIGFYHADPPPDFRHEWTLAGENDKMAARSYHMLWDEGKIKKLMSSERLREVNWNDKPPAERYRILVEEEEKQRLVDGELYKTETPSLQSTMWKTVVIGGIIALLTGFAYRVSLIEELEEVKLGRRRRDIQLSDLELPSGAVIDGRSRQDSNFTYSYMVNLREVREKLRKQTQATDIGATTAQE